MHYQAPMVPSSAAVDHCCGQCTIEYPEAIVYHWPMPGTNTWCDSIKTEVSVCSQEHHLIYDRSVTTPAPIKTTYWGEPVQQIPFVLDLYSNDDEGHIYMPTPTTGPYSVASNGFV